MRQYSKSIKQMREEEGEGEKKNTHREREKREREKREKRRERKEQRKGKNEREKERRKEFVPVKNRSRTLIINSNTDLCADESEIFPHVNSKRQKKALFVLVVCFGVSLFQV